LTPPEAQFAPECRLPFRSGPHRPWDRNRKDKEPSPFRKPRPVWPRQPENSYRRPVKQAYHSTDMTLCIGAIAWEQETNTDCIVLCCDYKVSGDECASETQYKFQTLSDQLVCMFADSAGRAKEAIWNYRAYLPTVQLTQQDIADHLLYPILKLKLRLARSYVGRRLGVEYTDFLANGAAWFGVDYHREYIKTIEEHPLRLQLVIAGFIDAVPILCEFRGEHIELCDSYAMIGSGAYIAEPAMHAREHDKNTALLRALYNVYEAKRLAETSPAVGQITKMFVLRPPEAHCSRIQVWVVTTEVENHLQKLFEEYGRKPMGRIPEFPTNALVLGKW